MADQSDILQQPSSSDLWNIAPPSNNFFIRQPVIYQSSPDTRTASPLNLGGTLNLDTRNNNATSHGQPVGTTNLDIRNKIPILKFVRQPETSSGSHEGIASGATPGPSNNNNYQSTATNVNGVSNRNGSLGLSGGVVTDTNQPEIKRIRLGPWELAQPTYNEDDSVNRLFDFNRNTNFQGHRQHPSRSQQSSLCNTSESGTQTNSTANVVGADNPQPSAYPFAGCPMNDSTGYRGLDNITRQCDVGNLWTSSNATSQTKYSLQGPSGHDYYPSSHRFHGQNRHRLHPKLILNPGHRNVTSQRGAPYSNPQQISVNKQAPTFHEFELAHSTTDNSLLPSRDIFDEYLQNPPANNHSRANDQYMYDDAANPGPGENLVRDQGNKRLMEWDQFFNSN